MKKISFLISVFFIMSVFVNAEEVKVSDVIKTKRLVLVDSSGNERVDLSVWEDGSVGLIMSGQNKKTKILIGMDKEDNPAIAVVDKSGNYVFYVPQKNIEKPQKENRKNATVKSFPISLMKIKAAEEWPDNFQMQEFEIKTQKEAYYFLQAYNPQIPSNVFAKIKTNAEADWPNNFLMQKFEIKNQVESYQSIK